MIQLKSPLTRLPLSLLYNVMDYLQTQDLSSLSKICALFKKPADLPKFQLSFLANDSEMENTHIFGLLINDRDLSLLSSKTPSLKTPVISGYDHLTASFFTSVKRPPNQKALIANNLSVNKTTIEHRKKD